MTALFSEDGRYRYLLTRYVGEGHPASRISLGLPSQVPLGQPDGLSAVSRAGRDTI